MVNPEPTPSLVIKNVSKKFPGVEALKNINLDIYYGEIHAILGENGAGKSTLMKILVGIIPRDSGEILLENISLHLENPRLALQAGIALVHQDLSLLLYLSVAENIFLGRWPKKGISIDWESMIETTNQLLNRFQVKVDPRALVGTLSVAEQQLIEILKAISHSHVKILLLDEPTSALSGEEINRLFQILLEIKSEGKSIIFISHKIDEAVKISDRITVLKDGEKVITDTKLNLDEKTIIYHMTGKYIDLDNFRHTPPVKEKNIALSLEEVGTKFYKKKISLNIYQGEILVVFGLMGSGKTTLARGLFGFETLEGTIRLFGNPVIINHPKIAIHLGIGYIPEDRRFGLIYELPVYANITLAILKKMIRNGVLQIKKEHEVAKHYVHALQIKPPNIFREILYLSGGNQQKVLLARWLAREPKILIMDEPTRGIDVGAKFEIRNFVKEMVREGLTVIYITSDPLEAIEMGDRIVVLRNGQIVTTFNNPLGLDKSEILAAASGVHYGREK
jgi:ribose transport system ATP-binding protein